jgi:tRNA/tmRNA/rRNA uracil-C5-methylase (TrmA/RlmC/RlmD family)
MRGENPDTTYVEDAEHWSGVYKELLAFKQDLLTFTKERIARMKPPASNELATTDLVIMEAEHDRLRVRFDFWEARRRELQQAS